MASRGRDLTFSLLSDANAFDLAAPADDLDDLGTAAKDAGAALDKLDADAKGTKLGKSGKDAKGAGDDLDRLATDAKGAATKVDSAFDKIAKSSKHGMDTVKREGKEGFADFKEESQSELKEASASFGSIEDAADSLQSILGNAFAGFGPAGMAAGIAAATGVGFITAGLQSAAEKAAQTKQRIIDLAGAITDADGALSKVDFVGTMREWGAEIANEKSWWEVWQKSAVTNLEVVQKQAKDAGIDFHDMWQAMSGNDAQAITASLDEINAALTKNTAASKDHAQATAFDEASSTDAITQGLDKQKAALEDARQAILDKAGETEEGIRLAGLQAEADGRSAKATEDYAEAVKATRDAIADVGTTAMQSAAEQAKSIDDVIAAQEKAISAQRDFASNTKEVLAEVGQEGVEWAETFGPLAPKMMQLLADAPKKKQKEIIANYRKAGVTAGSATADGIYSQTSTVAAAGTAIYNAAAAAVRRQGGIKIDFSTGGSNITNETRIALLNAQRYAALHPIILHTKYAPTGQKPQRDIP